MPPTRLSRKAKQLNNRAAIIDAAVIQFANHGVEGTSLDAIARHAGLTQGAIYSNFESKAALWWAVIGQLSRTLDLAKLLDATLPLRDQFAILGSAVWHLLISLSRTELLLTQELDLFLMRRPRERAKHARALRACDLELAEVLHRGASERNEILPMEADLLARTINNLAYGLLHRYMLDPGAIDEDLCVGAITALAAPR